ncbi:unnamed protein product [Dracunculus medinensis]|uniref:Metalloendopeptidase n=1 Tax=Dracunculus medinensis TaxID=318479 RepID=A0A0N4UH45_DRAME|nr:unnamed protein product [Dracunculus medinensis]
MAVQIKINYATNILLLFIISNDYLYAQFALPRADETVVRRNKRDINEGIEEARALLKGFLKLSADVPLTPQRRSNFGSKRINYKVMDRTEYHANRKILDEVFETDLILTVPQRIKRTKRKAIIGESFRWPNQVIPYILKENDSEWKKLILSGMKKWETETCIRFKQRSAEKDYVHIFKGAGCYSSVGRIGGKQYTSIGFGCGSEGIVAHELGHTIGFWHEQSRPDRDKYININEDHLISGTKGNFERRDDILDLSTTYDYGSVMHYGPQAFTDDYNFLTIETKDHRFQHTIDRCRKKLDCLHGGYENPRNCAVCKCPSGLSGTRCESIPHSTGKCGGELTASQIWQTLKSKTVGKCFWRITSTTGKVRLEVLDASYVCDSSCSDNYLEIKHKKNLEQTGFRQCCNGAPGIILSETNRVYIISISIKNPSYFTLRYITDSLLTPVPKPPPDRWNGGGITALIGAENGIDNSWEHFILKQLPDVLKKIGRPSNNPWSTIVI